MYRSMTQKNKWRVSAFRLPFVLALAALLAALAQPAIAEPEIEITGNGVVINSGDHTASLADHTDFGRPAAGQSVMRVFQISNAGDSELALNGKPQVLLSGRHVSDFDVLVQPGPSVSGSENTTFTVQFTPSADGLRTATISIANDDADEPLYTFAIQGARAGTLSDGGSVCEGNVVEAAGYSLAYQLAIPDDSATQEGFPSYQVDNSSAIGPYNRVAYCLELDDQWVWVSMDDFTAGEITRTGVPVEAVTPDGFQQKISNMTVESNVEGVTSGANLATGNIEFWPKSYDTPTVPGLMLNGDGTTYDYDDTIGNSVYGSMQVHNHGTGETLFAYNAWNHSHTDEIGIGNNPTNGQHPDWTFAGNVASYSTRTLSVYVKNHPTTVFVTSQSYNSDLGGLVGADAKCQGLAASAGLAGVYKAWLSTTAENAKDRIPQQGPYQLVDGTTISETLADLTDGTREREINIDEGGREWGGWVWTGTSETGVLAQSRVFPEDDVDCGAWEGFGLRGIRGVPSADTSWTHEGVVLNRIEREEIIDLFDCEERSALYCFGR